jgi:small subunit ribosomal protein S17
MRERKKELVGRVVSDKMEKTVVVAVDSLRRHRLYLRMMRRTKKYMAHDEENNCHVGDLVRIQESKPVSRHKHWRVVSVLEEAAKRGKAVDIPQVGTMAGAPAVDAVATSDVASVVLTGSEAPTGDADSSRGGGQ